MTQHPPTPAARPGESFKEETFSATPETVGLRIDKALASHPLVATRSQASRLLSRELVWFEGAPVKPSHVIKASDIFHVFIPQVPTQTLVPYDFPLNIAYENADLIVVDKPANLVVHPAYGHAHDTLVNALLHHTTDLSQGFNEMRPGLVHRLDKDTSGLIVIAKNEHAQRELALQFQRKITHRIYRALVFGEMKPPAGTVQSNLKRHPEDRRRSASQEDGKLAITHYRTLATHPTGISLLELKLETGRTHQIRVHVTESGHPIVGDTLYGADKRIKSLKSVALRRMVEELPRFALHAFELGFYHPTSGKFMLLQSVWPEDLRPLVEHCDFPLFDEKSQVHIFDKRPEDSYPWPRLRSTLQDPDDDE